MKKTFCLTVYFKIRKFIFRQSESCVLTMSSWSRRVKICGLKSSIEVQLPTVNSNLKKMLYSCLFTSFVSCYCALIYNRRKQQHCDHRSLFPSPSRITSRLLRRFECVAWRIVNNNNGPNGHLFYVGGDLMMRRGMLPIIMLPDGHLRFTLHLVPFWILTIWGSAHIEETVVGWRNQLRMKTSAT